MIGALRRALLATVGRAGALTSAGLQAGLAPAEPQTDLEQRIEQARRRLKATIPPPES